MTTADLRTLLTADHVTHAPGVYDSASAALAVRAGHRAVHLSGAAIAATMLGRPDLKGTPPTQIADRAALLRPVLGSVPLLADADIGYDSPDHAVWTALAYQRAGISGLRLDAGEDTASGAARIAALVEQAPAVALIAEAGGPELSLARTIERCRVYAAAGADAILPVGVENPDDLGRLRDALAGVPLVVSRSATAAGGSRRSDAELADLGVRLVLHPLTAVLAALRAASLTYRAIADHGNADRIDRLPPAVYAALVGRPAAAHATSAERPAAAYTTSAGRPAAAYTTSAEQPAALYAGPDLEKIDKIDT